MPTTAIMIIARHTRIAMRKFILRLIAVTAATNSSLQPGVKFSPSAGLPKSYTVLFPSAVKVRFLMHPANPSPLGRANLQQKRTVTIINRFIFLVKYENWIAHASVEMRRFHDLYLPKTSSSRRQNGIIGGTTI